MARELQDYQIKVGPGGDAKFGTFSTGTHDHLVTALGLATQEERPRPSVGVACGTRTFDNSTMERLPGFPPELRGLGRVYRPR